MINDENSLEKEFIKDHQKLTRGFSDIIDAIKQDKWSDAVASAEELNREGGAHIAFEEEMLYPQVTQSRGEGSVSHLYDEHQTAIAGLRFLLDHPQAKNIAPEQKTELLRNLQTGLDHVVSCGTLLSYLTVLDKNTQSDLLAKLRGLREENKSMLDLVQA